MEELINNIMQSPENTNPNVLRSQLKAIQGEGSGGPGYSVEKQRTILFDGSVFTKSDPDSDMFYETISEYITAPTIIVTFGDDEYILEQTSVGGGAMGYGEFGDDQPLFTNIPFAIVSKPMIGKTRLYTESGGTYSIQIESDEIVVTPTDEFKEAVANSNTRAIYAGFYSLPHNVDETEQWACDKTYDELVAAYNSGSVILGEITGHVFVMLYEPRRGVFSGDTIVYKTTDASKLFYYSVTMRSDDPLDINVYRGSISIGR